MRPTLVLEHWKWRQATPATDIGMNCEQIKAWFLSKARSLNESGARLADIRENTHEPEGALADFDGVETLGRITGRVDGQFDFDVISQGDGVTLYSRYVENASFEDGRLDTAYAEFTHYLLNPDAPPALGRGIPAQ